MAAASAGVEEERKSGSSTDEMFAAAAAQRSRFTLPLSGDRVTLRPWRLADAEDLVKQANNRQVWLNLRDRFPHPYSAADAAEWLGLQLKAKVPLTNVVIEVGGRFAGSVGIELHHDVHRFSAELGYWLGEEFWGRGLMTEAVGLFLGYAFSHFRLLRIEAGCFARNAASAKVLTKTGFHLEGRARQSVYKDGVVLDQLIHSKLCTEQFPKDTVKDSHSEPAS